MTRKRGIMSFAWAPVVALSLLAFTACSSSAGASGSTGPPSTSGGPQGTVDVAASSLGQILVDDQGRTLYMFQKDMGAQSECTGACASAWPPLLATGTPTVGSGASASALGTTARSDGGTQVIYNGHPVYTFSQDQKAGDTNGEGLTAFGGSWFVLSPSGNQISGPPSNSGAGNGY